MRDPSLVKDASPPKQLRVLITNMALSGRSGTEIYTKSLALKLLRKGHLPVVYSPVLGEIADEIRAAGIPVTDHISAVGGAPDVMHCHHSHTTATVVARFPDVPAIFVCHDFAAWHDAPPRLGSIRRYVAIVQSTADRLVYEGGVAPEQTRIVLNAIDTDRFRSSTPPAPRPRKAAVFAKGRAYLAAIQQACAARNIDCDLYGLSVGNLIDAPEEVMPKYDIVFTSGLGAMEAIASNRAVIVCDERGLAGLCTEDRYSELRQANFGLRALRNPLTKDAILAEIDLYDASDVARCCQLIRADADLDTYVDTLISMYREVIAENARQPVASAATAAALSDYFESWGPRPLDSRWPWMIERQHLLSQLQHLTFGLTSIELNERYRFDDTEKREWFHSSGGLGPAENFGRWTLAKHVSLLILLPPGLQASLRLDIEMNAFVAERHPQQKAIVLANGLPVADLTFAFPAGAQPTRYNIPIPIEAMDPNGDLWLRFVVERAVSPLEAGHSNDGRPLGLGLSALAFTHQA